jgi:hypothetical protein
MRFETPCISGALIKLVQQFFADERRGTITRKGRMGK